MNDSPDATPVKVALFGKEAENPPTEEDTVRISHCYAYRMRNKGGQGQSTHAESLGTKPSAEIEVSKSD